MTDENAMKKGRGQELRSAVAQDIFAKRGYPVLYFTSDNIPFAREDEALKHASKLKDRTVTTEKRK